VQKLLFIIVTSGGTAIPPTEVEEVLLTHPAVAESAYVELEGPGGKQIPALMVVLREGAHLSRPDIRDFYTRNIA